MNGTKVTQFEGHLCELMWRLWERRPKAEAILLLSLITQYYRLDGPPQFVAGNAVFSCWSRLPNDDQDGSMCQYNSDDEQGTDTDVSGVPTRPTPTAGLTTSSQTAGSSRSTETTSQQRSPSDVEPSNTSPAEERHQPKTTKLSLVKNRRMVSKPSSTYSNERNNCRRHCTDSYNVLLLSCNSW